MFSKKSQHRNSFLRRYSKIDKIDKVQRSLDEIYFQNFTQVDNLYQRASINEIFDYQRKYSRGFGAVGFEKLVRK